MVVDDAVAEDPVKPGHRRVARAQLVQPLDRARVGFLQEILGERAALDATGDEGQEGRAMGEERLDGIRVHA